MNRRDDLFLFILVLVGGTALCCVLFRMLLTWAIDP